MYFRFVPYVEVFLKRHKFENYQNEFDFGVLTPTPSELKRTPEKRRKASQEARKNAHWKGRGNPD
ncbi:hypothetical protein [Methanosarcina sp.]|uniref:hypothetical protein n=1 Tax=Methanosarcina sp. TaxID=2213 RepID=UPI003C74F76D